MILFNSSKYEVQILCDENLSKGTDKYRPNENSILLYPNPGLYF